MEDDGNWKETSCISLSFLHYYLRILKSLKNLKMAIAKG